jgi:glutamate formiminotransferase/formiminotetrahydrofolate cyclodeaminase
MVSPLVECVPNISEGRDLAKIEQIVNAVRAVPGCTVLGVEPDHDYHRTVITFAGAPDAVVEGAVALINASIDLIDMSQHKGEHPRMGAVDVCPFVPLRGIDLDACAKLAKQTLDRIAELHDVPLFLYGHAASSEDRKLLSTLRKGEYEGLKPRLSGGETVHDSTTRFPDAGGRDWNEATRRSGAITIGARSILVAYNVNVEEPDARVAKMVGSLVRSSGRLLKSESGQKVRAKGMLPHVQGMGVPLEELGISQVSMNLLDVDACPLHLAYKTCESIANDHGVPLCGSEIVGLVPLQAMLDAGRFFDPQASDDAALVNAAIMGLGLNAHHRFSPREHIIEWAINSEVRA